MNYKIFDDSNQYAAFNINKKKLYFEYFFESFFWHP